MLVKDVMTKDTCVLNIAATVQEVAEKMKENKCGFIPLGANDRLHGVVTDRDIVVRCIAEGKDTHKTKASEVLTDKVLYCFEEDDVEDAADSMREQQVYRLIVLNNKEDKRLRGIVTLGDISREYRDIDLSGRTTLEVCKQAA